MKLFVSPLAYITDAVYGVLIHNGANFSHDFIDDVSSESASAEEAAAAATTALCDNAIIIVQMKITRVKEPKKDIIAVGT